MLTADDDRFHPVADPDPLWTETTWWGFLVPERALGGMVYTLFRPNLGVASVIVQVWDSTAVEPWRSPYARQQWHLPMPSADITDCEVGGLALRCLEPLTAYRLTYADGHVLDLDLTYRALGAPDEVPIPGGSGHFDQVCAVTGTVVLDGEVVAVNAPAVRDRSWYVRQDRRTMRAGYTYAVVDADHHVVVHSRAAPERGGDDGSVLGGYLVRDGERSPLTGGTRRVVSRRRGHPDVVEVEATDAAGRTVAASGRTAASLASQSTPGMFAWMSVLEWTVDGRPAVGEDHDVWSPDLLTRAVRSPEVPA